MSRFRVSGHCSFFVGMVFPESQSLQSIVAAWIFAPWNECAGICSLCVFQEILGCENLAIVVFVSGIIFEFNSSC